MCKTVSKHALIYVPGLGRLWSFRCKSSVLTVRTHVLPESKKERVVECFSKIKVWWESNPLQLSK